MKAILMAVAASVLAVSVAACSGGGGGGGGSGSISSGAYTTSNARYSPDSCGAEAQNPAAGFNGQVLTVTSNATGINVAGEDFVGSGSSFAAAVVSTNNDLSGFGIDCILHIVQADTIVAHGVDVFSMKRDVKASKVSGTQCDAGTIGITLPCESALLADAAK